MMFSRTVSSPKTPSFFRSSEQNPMPAIMALVES